MVLEGLPGMLIAIFVFIILFTGSLLFVMDLAIKTIEQKANSLSISCSETPKLSASTITLGNTVFYCFLSET